MHGVQLELGGVLQHDLLTGHNKTEPGSALQENEGTPDTLILKLTKCNNLPSSDGSNWTKLNDSSTADKSLMAEHRVSTFVLVK